MKWFKSSSNMTTDPLMMLVAQEAKCYRHEVIAVWQHFLERAANNSEKGNGYLGNINFKEVDLALELLPGKAKAIYVAFEQQEKIKDSCIVNWRKRQIDPTASKRMQDYRERLRDVTVTNGNVTFATAVTPEESRVEENINTPYTRTGVIFPDEVLSPEYEMIFMLTGLDKKRCQEEYEAFKNYYNARPDPRIKSFIGLWKNWVKKINQGEENARNQGHNRKHSTSGSHHKAHRESPHEVAGRAWAEAGGVPVKSS